MHEGKTAIDETRGYVDESYFRNGSAHSRTKTPHHVIRDKCPANLGALDRIAEFVVAFD